MKSSGSRCLFTVANAAPAESGVVSFMSSPIYVSVDLSLQGCACSKSGSQRFSVRPRTWDERALGWQRARGDNDVRWVLLPKGSEPRLEQIWCGRMVACSGSLLIKKHDLHLLAWLTCFFAFLRPGLSFPLSLCLSPLQLHGYG